MELARPHLTVLLNALYDSGEESFAVRHPSDEIGELLRVDLDDPSDDELQRAVVPKPSDFTGSKYAEDISDVRITGSPEFIEAVAGRLKALQDMEDGDTRLEINLQQTEDRDTGELTDNYALYLSVAQWG